MDAPQTGEVLLRDVWTIVQNAPTVQYLYYLQNPDPDATPYEGSFWRFDLQTGQQTKIAARPLESILDQLVQGQLSSDGQWIAYQRDTGENSADLFLMRSDGTDETLLARGVGTVAEGCEAYFAWSPDSSKLAFNRYDEQAATPGWQLEVIAVEQPTLATRVVANPFLKFIGWTDAEHLLLLTGVPPAEALHIDEASVTTQTSRTVLAFERGVGAGCFELAPDGKQLLVNMDGGGIFDLSSQTMRPAPISDTFHGGWSPDSSAFVTLPQQNLDQAVFARSANATVTQTVRLAPAALPTSETGWRLLWASPDGRYLASCQLTRLPDRRSGFRMVVYDIVNNRWSLVAPGCGFVLGWT